MLTTAQRGRAYYVVQPLFYVRPHHVMRGRVERGVPLMGAEASAPSLPTYSTVADVLEKKNGSGWRLFGWTIARMIMIAPPMMMVGVPAMLAIRGAALSSGLISLFTLIRISEAAKAQGVHA